MRPVLSTRWQSVLKDNPCFGSPKLFSAASVMPLPAEIEDHDNRVTFASMFPYLGNKVSVFDVGCGWDAELPKALLDQGCSYFGVDQYEELLAPKYDELKKSNPGALMDFQRMNILSDLDIMDDDSCDIVLMKSVLEHLPPDSWQDAIRQLYRIAKKAVFIVNASWSRVGNHERPDLFETLREVHRKLYGSHGKEAYISRKVPEIITLALSGKPMEVFRIDDRPAGDYRESFIDVCYGGMECAMNCYDGKDKAQLVGMLAEVVDYLTDESVTLNPAAYVVAHIPKVT